MSRAFTLEEAADALRKTPERRMTLKQAAELFFGDARHAATLRVEIDRGNLVASKIGRAYWTTLQLRSRTA